MTAPFTRPPRDWRFNFGGLKTNMAPDQMPPEKYPIAINVRSFADGQVRTRSGQLLRFATGGNPILALRGYLGQAGAAGTLAETPRLLAVDSASGVWLDNATQVGALLAPSTALGFSMITFRPNESPVPWMYISSFGDYQKFSAPSPSNVVTQALAGIAEPQIAPDAAPSAEQQASLSGLTWTSGGTASAAGSGVRVADTIGTVLPDPRNANLLSAQVSSAPYQRWMTIAAVGGGTPGSFGPVSGSTFADGGGTEPWTIGGSSASITLPPQSTGPVSSDNLLVTGFTGFIGNVPAGAVITGVQVTWPRSGGQDVYDNLVQLVKAGSPAGIDHSSGSAWGPGSRPLTYGGPGDTWGLTLLASDVLSSNFGCCISAVNTSLTRSETAVVGSSPTITLFWTSGSVSGSAVLIRDVFPPLPSALAISAIQYYSGTTGRCVIVPANLAAGPGINDQSAFQQNLLATLRRGAIIKVGSEFCIVWAAVPGPNGTVSIETSTTATHTTADTLTAVSTIQTLGVLSGGQSISENDITYQVTVGIGSQTAPVASNPFVTSNAAFRPDDYISFGILIDNLANLNEMKLLFDVGDGSFTQNYFYYTIRPSDIEAALTNAATGLSIAQTLAQRAIVDSLSPTDTSSGGLSTASGDQTAPGASQWTQILIPLSSLTRVGNDQTKSLQNINSIQFLWNASGTINVAHDTTISIIGGYSGDVGDIGAPYLYRVRPRSSSTGAVGNPSPATRYGVTARREQITVYLPPSNYDPQIDTWDVFRYGGTVTSFRYIGSAPSSQGTFIDNYDDNAAQAGDALDFDNFEPWPTVDVPFNATATVVSGHIAIVTVPVGTNVLSFLPGSLVQIGGNNVYTLWARPSFISRTSYLFQFVENAGALTNASVSIAEPALADRNLPYLFGPDANGTVFGCGDLYRSGTLSYAKNYAPDSVPDTYNTEITPPSEPLLGGEILDGLAFVASTERWWSLDFQPSNTSQRYAVIQQPWPRGLAAPFGHCNDGQSIYWWAKDGIWSSSKGSLTDDDLYNLFPHGNVKGQAISYATSPTIFPPDYSKTASFRLAYANSYLYATYVGTDGTYHTLVLNLRTMAWSLDNYSPQITIAYHPEQEAGAVQVAGGPFDELVMGNTAGQVSAIADFTNDLSAPISSVVGRFEFDGGDARAPKQWGDVFLDTTPAAMAGVIVTPTSLSQGVITPQTIASASVRQRQALNLGGVFISEFLGLLFTWTDDFTQQTAPTTLFIAQPSFAIQPARALGWKTFGGAFGLTGYGHLPQIVLAWVSTAPITLTLTTFDGQSPAPITIPSSGGAYRKAVFRIGANKGLLFAFQAVSTAPFQLFLDDSSLWVGEWDRSGPYTRAKDFGSVVQETGAV